MKREIKLWLSAILVVALFFGVIALLVMNKVAMLIFASTVGSLSLFALVKMIRDLIEPFIKADEEYYKQMDDEAYWAKLL